MFIFDLISDNIDSLAPLKRWPAGLLIAFELAISGVAAKFLLESEFFNYNDAVAGNILAALSLFGSVLIAAIIQLHSNIKSYNDQRTIILKKSGSSEALSRQSEWAYRVMRSDAKIAAAKFLFSNLMLNLIHAFFTSGFLIAFLMSKNGSPFRAIADVISLTLVINFAFSNYRTVRRVYIFMNDDFSPEVSSQNDINNSSSE